MISREQSLRLEITNTEYALFAKYFQVESLNRQDLGKVISVGYDLVVSAFENKLNAILFYSNRMKQIQNFPYRMPPPSRQAKKEVRFSLSIQQGGLEKLQELTGLENLAGDYLLYVIKNHFSSLSAGYFLSHQNIFFSSTNLTLDFYNKIENWFPGANSSI